MEPQFEQKLALNGGAKVRELVWPEWPSYDDGTERALNSVLRSGRWTISGPFAGESSKERSFARQFAEYCDARYCTPVTSGSASLTIALLALGIGAGDEVLIPGLTWVACASATMAVGAVPIMVDIDPATLAMSVDEARRAVSDRTAAIMVVHPYCRTADLGGFLALSKEIDVPLVEDCSHAQNARRRQFADALRRKLQSQAIARLPPGDSRSEPTYYNLVLELDMNQFGGNSVDAVARAMAAELGVQVSPIYRPTNRHPLYRPLLSPRYRGDAARAAALDPSRFSLPNAEAARGRFITFPNWVLLAGEQGVEDILTALRKVAACGKELRSLEQAVSQQAF